VQFAPQGTRIGHWYLLSMPRLFGGVLRDRLMAGPPSPDGVDTCDGALIEGRSDFSRTEINRGDGLWSD
jgi:hypothetical protein